MCPECGKRCVGMPSCDVPPLAQVATEAMFFSHVQPQPGLRIWPLSYSCGLKVWQAGGLWPGSWLFVDVRVNGGVGGVGGGVFPLQMISRVTSLRREKPRRSLSAAVDFHYTFAFPHTRDVPVSLLMSLLPGQQSCEPDTCCVASTL